jgi:FeS assembly protein IscX
MVYRFGWTDIEDIAIALAETHPQVDPLTVKFTELRRMVEELEGFSADVDHQVNEQILEAIQYAWTQERQEMEREKGEDDEGSGYSPNQPFRD